MEEVVIPVGNAKVIYEIGRPRKFIVDCVPMSSIRSANRDLHVSYTEIPDYVEYFSPDGRLVIAGYTTSKLHHTIQNLYITIPGMHHIVWSDFLYKELPIETPGGLRERRLEIRAFVSVSDTVNVGLVYRDTFFGNKAFIIKRVMKNSWNSILTAVGLPDPIPKRDKKFKISEESYKELIEIHSEGMKSINKRGTKWLRGKNKESIRLTNKWLHDIISTEIGTYNYDNYIVNWRAVGTHPDIKSKLSDLLWREAKDLAFYACRDSKNFRGKMRVDLNRILIKKV